MVLFYFGNIAKSQGVKSDEYCGYDFIISVFFFELLTIEVRTCRIELLYGDHFQTVFLIDRIVFILCLIHPYHTRF